MDKLKVFISGTQRDLQTERDAVEAALSSSFVVIRAENQGSRDYSSREAITAFVEECDIYVGLFGHRYGYIVKEEKMSVTELEFAIARKYRKPILVYVKKLGPGEKRQARQSSFLNRVTKFETGLFRRPQFTDSKKLAKWVAEDIQDLLARRFHQYGVPSAPFMVPRDIHYFVDREAELEELHKALQPSEDGKVYSFYGMGGVGKTALSIHFAHKFRRLYNDGVLWADLEKSSTSEILYAFAQAYNKGTEITDLSSIDSRVAFVKSLLVGKEVLVILDNATSSKQIIPVLEACSNCSIIVTSRYKSLSALRDSTPLDVRPLTPQQAMRLLLAIVGKEQADGKPSAKGLKANEMGESPEEEICRRAGYLPLALRIIAERMNYSKYSAHHMVERLRKKYLEEIGYGRERTKDTDIRVSFGISYEDLSPELQEFFLSLGVFSSSDFDITAAAYVSGTDTDGAERLIEELYALCLVEASRKGRWKLHSLLSEYVRERNTDESAYGRMADYFVALAEQAESQQNSDKQLQWLDRLEEELDNLGTVLQWCLQSGNHSDTGLRLGVSLYWFWEARGYLNKAKEWLELLLNRSSPDVQHELRAKALDALGQIAVFQCEYSVAESYFQESLKIWETTPGPTQQLHLALASGNMGRMAWHQEQYDAAKALVDKCLVIYKELEDKSGIAWSHLWLGRIASRQNEYDMAVDHLQYSLELYQQLADDLGITSALESLGRVAWQQGRYELAESLFKQGLMLRRRLNHRPGLAWSFHGLADVVYAQKDPERSARLLGMAQAQLDITGFHLDPVNQRRFERTSNSVREVLGEPVWATLFAEGRNMTVEAALDYGLAKSAE